jgi:hypothetical protein
MADGFTPDTDQTDAEMKHLALIRAAKRLREMGSEPSPSPISTPATLGPTEKQQYATEAEIDDDTKAMILKRLRMK